MSRRNRYKVTVKGRLGLYMNYGDKYHFYRKAYILILAQRTGVWPV